MINSTVYLCIKRGAAQRGAASGGAAPLGFDWEMTFEKFRGNWFTIDEEIARIMQARLIMNLATAPPNAAPRGAEKNQ